MKAHHARAIAKARERLCAENPNLIAIILGGSIEDFRDWGKPFALNRFLQDVELCWYNRVHAVSEW